MDLQVIGEFVTEQHITGLSPFTTYMVRIAGVAPGGVVGELSEPFQLTTLEARKHISELVFDEN